MDTQTTMMIEVASWTYLTLLSQGGAEKIISDYGVGRPEAVQPFQPSPRSMSAWPVGFAAAMGGLQRSNVDLEEVREKMKLLSFGIEGYAVRHRTSILKLKWAHNARVAT